MDGRVKPTGDDPETAAKIRALIEQHMPGKTVTLCTAVSSYDIDADKTTTKVTITLAG